MAEMSTWVLTDADHDIWLDSFAIGPHDLGLPAKYPWSIRKRTLRAGLSAGVDLIQVDNGVLSFSVLPTRGMGIWRGRLKGLDVGWCAPVKGPVHPHFINLQERGGLGWVAGFDEVVVRCGLDSMGAPGKDVVPNNNGVPSEVELTLHGKIANLPAARVEVQVIPGDPPELVVSGDTYEAALFCPQYRLRSRISTRAGSNSLTIADEVTNLRSTAAEMELLYHCNFGPPFLGLGARLEVPARTVAPRDPRAVEGLGSYDTYLGPTPGYVEQVYWYELLAEEDGRTLAMLRNAEADKGLVLRFNRHELPAFTQWKNTGAESDGYVTGLEPGTAFPNVKGFERQQGRLVRMAPGDAYRITLGLEVHDSQEGVAAVAAQIARLQAQANRTVHQQPVPTYSQL